ncbi:DUF2189 domain-containing protein [Limibaculum sp. M0105]|uniref:DUF2189 domain-containing protein n=1 Tax=Thermohalobaculum xanthum TaxID=2753746 RepID=A0A8J7M8C5_9RHOB|nr:DUF2189 domain-containing protein [Thermohalobaculum xanthum]MBK0400459.1 DUF2189 domain-containing protein [Thermohalobaculum xanthum]
MAASGTADENRGPWRETKGVPPVRAATVEDLKAALAAGWADFRAAPLVGAIVGAVYVLGGWLLLWVIEARDLRGLTFPVVAGFALVGPFFATILYEVSRRREYGLPFSLSDAAAMVRATARRQIIYLGFALMFWLAVWSRIGVMLFALHFSAQPERFFDLMDQFLTTSHGISFLIVGHAFGAFFAAVAFALSVVAFPFLLDRDSDVITAIVTSFKTVLASPVVMLGWGVFIGVALAVASLPVFLGLVVVLPVLGHASWHLYRRLVED